MEINHPGQRVSALREGDATEIATAYRKITWRLLPLLFVCYFFNYLDRTNIGIAQLQMKQELGFSDAAYGLGAGLLYIGFIFFEVPSTVMLNRIGARRTLLRIMVSWGAVTCLTSLVRTPVEFYVARILLGVAEAGFIPGILLYLSYWFPLQRRARVTATFLLAIPISGVIGNPLSSFIVEHFSGAFQLHGWQWLFLLEGFPSILLGVAAWAYLTDRPEGATWLTARQRAIVTESLNQGNERKTAGSHGKLASVLKDRRVWAISFVLFSSLLISNTLTFWSPAIIQRSGVARFADIGLLAAVPPLTGAIGMLLVGRHSDRVMERRWHTVIPLGFAALGLALLPAFADAPMLSIIFLSVVATGYYSSLPTLYSLPSSYLSGGGAPAGIALMTSIGSLGAAIAPSFLGLIRNATGSFNVGFQIYALVAFLGAVTLLCIVPGRLLGESLEPER